MGNEKLNGMAYYNATDMNKALGNVTADLEAMNKQPSHDPTSKKDVAMLEESEEFAVDDDESIMVEDDDEFDEYTFQDGDDANATMIEEIDLEAELINQMEKDMNSIRETNTTGMDQLPDPSAEMQMNEPVKASENYEKEMNKEVPVDTKLEN